MVRHSQDNSRSFYHKSLTDMTSLVPLPGMGNRFSTLTQYHSLILAHGVLGAIVFLFLVPAAILYARFYTRRPGYAIRYHAYLNILSALMTVCLFILGWFAVGPNRSLTNPHHGIGVAILTLILLQIVGGRLIKNIRGRSLRVMLHQWFGRAIALLGIAQVPLGLTLYGSPKVLFILYAVWMGFLLLLYFILSYRAHDRPDYHIHEERSEVTRTERTDHKSSRGASGWLGPVAAGTGIWALLRGRKRGQEDRERSGSRSRASRVHSRSRSRAPEVIPSRRGSYVEEEKYSDRYSVKPTRKSTGGAEGGGGFMNKLAGAGAGLGAGALIGRMMGRPSRREDEEYSAVAHDTPSRRRRSRSVRRHGGTVLSDYSDESEEYRRDGRRSPLLPGPGGPSTMAAAISAAESRPGGSRPTRPLTPQRSHGAATSRLESTIDSDYSSYVSPSRRADEIRHENKRHSTGAAEKGLLAGLGAGWLAKRMKDRRDRKDEDRLRMEEEERRSGRHEPRYTGDGYGYNSPPRRRESHRSSMRPAAPARVETETTRMTDESQSLIEPRPLSGYDAPMYHPRPTGQYQAASPAPGPVPPAASSFMSHHTGGAASGTIPVALDQRTYPREHSRHSLVEPATMPDMPPDPKGILARSSDGDSLMSRRDRRRSASRIRAEEATAAGMAAAEEEAQKRAEQERAASRGRTPPVSVKVKVHDDKDRNVTLRRLTEEEAMAARRARRRRADSASSMSGSDVASGSRSRYRRESSRRRAAEQDAESTVAPLSPPAPSFAGGGRRPKDSAYYSGPVPGPSGATPAAGATVSTLASRSSPGGHGTWSGVSPVPNEPVGIPGQSEASATASAAERRRRRRLERRNERPAATGTVDFT